VEFRNERLFVYLKLQSLVICVDMLFAVIYPYYTVRNSTINDSFLSTFIFIYGFCYFQDVLEKTELAYTIIAAYCCYKMITQLNTRPSTLSQSMFANPYVIAAFLLALLSFTTSQKVFRNQMDVYVNAENQTIYRIVLTPFSNTDFYKILEVLSFSLNNGLCLLILIVMDLLILIKLRKNLNMKLKLTNNITEVNRSKVELTKTIFLDCFNSIICHFCIVLFYVLRNTLESGFSSHTPFWLVVYFSYSFKFFIFYFFNRRFRHNVCKKMSRLKFYRS
jgi:hypothetical protein